MRNTPTVLAVLSLAVFGAAAPLQAQIVRGLVVDSITNQPVGGAVVVVLDSQNAEVTRTTADEEGLFLVQLTDGDWYTLRAEKEGYRTSTFPPFELNRGEVKGFMLLVANLDPSPLLFSVSEIIANVCAPGEAQSDQPLVIGLVRDADTKEPVPHATVAVAWPAVPSGLAALVKRDDIGLLGGTIEADSMGFYAACGLPLEATVSMHATFDNAMSDFLALFFSSDGVLRNQTFHAMDNIVWRQDLELRPPDQRTAAMTGSVSSAEKSEPVVGAIVRITETAFQTRTNSQGVFSLNRLPAGPAQLSIQAPGLRPMLQEVELVRGETVAVPALAMEVAPSELAPIAIEAPAPTNVRRPLDDFERRRRESNGDFITREEFERSGPRMTTDLLRRMRGVRITPNVQFQEVGPPLLISMSRSFRRSEECPPLFFLDGQYLGNAFNTDVNSVVPVEIIEAIEVYGATAGLPQELNRRGSSCGVIAFWTR